MYKIFKAQGQSSLAESVQILDFFGNLLEVEPVAGFLLQAHNQIAARVQTEFGRHSHALHKLLTLDVELVLILGRQLILFVVDLDCSQA